MAFLCYMSILPHTCWQNQCPFLCLCCQMLICWTVYACWIKDAYLLKGFDAVKETFTLFHQLSHILPQLYSLHKSKAAWQSGLALLHLTSPPIYPFFFSLDKTQFSMKPLMEFPSAPFPFALLCTPWRCSFPLSLLSSSLQSGSLCNALKQQVNQKLRLLQMMNNITFYLT